MFYSLVSVMFSVLLIEFSYSAFYANNQFAVAVGVSLFNRRGRFSRAQPSPPRPTAARHIASNKTPGAPVPQVLRAHHQRELARGSHCCAPDGLGLHGEAPTPTTANITRTQRTVCPASIQSPSPPPQSSIFLLVLPCMVRTDCRCHGSWSSQLHRLRAGLLCRESHVTPPSRPSPLLRGHARDRPAHLVAPTSPSHRASPSASP